MPPTKQILDRHVSLRMPYELFDALEERAELAERTVGAEIRLALKDWVKRSRKGRS